MVSNNGPRARGRSPHLMSIRSARTKKSAREELVTDHTGPFRVPSELNRVALVMISPLGMVKKDPLEQKRYACGEKSPHAKRK